MKLPLKYTGRNIVDDDDQLICAVGESEFDPADDDVHGAQIVRAVNAHDALVEACRKALAGLRAMRTSMHDNALAEESDNPHAAELLREYAPTEDSVLEETLRAALEPATA